MYQNPLVYWYNHYPDQGFAGPRFEIHDDAIVIGGGLASIDVVKIINFELYKRALAARGIHVTTLELEHAGIPETLAKHSLTQAELGVQRRATLYYRREKAAMPLASPPDNATPEQLAKIAAGARQGDGQGHREVPGALRAEPRCRSSPLLEDGRMVGHPLSAHAHDRTASSSRSPGDVVDVRSRRWSSARSAPSRCPSRACP